ncbi:MAG: Lcl C-terminal domain-containing protein [Rhodospirillaceae bacterium]
MFARGLIAAGALISIVGNAPLALAAACEDSSQPGRFVAKGDEVLDTKTNLTWQRCSVGQHLEGDICTGTVEAVDWNQAKKKARGGWRLPTLEELTSIAAQPCGMATADKKTFSGMDPIKPWYWTSTETEKDLAWIVGFNNGSTFNGYRTAPNAVRLVKSAK